MAQKVNQTYTKLQKSGTKLARTDIKVRNSGRNMHKRFIPGDKKWKELGKN
jgi:hypothetical protein